MSGQECSSTKADFICAARVPGGVNCRGNVHGHRIRSRLHDKILFRGGKYAAVNKQQENRKTKEELQKAWNGSSGCAERETL